MGWKKDLFVEAFKPEADPDSYETWKDPWVEATKDWKYPVVDPDSYETPYLRLPEKFFPKPYRKGDEERYPGKYVPEEDPKPDLLAAVMGKGAPYIPEPEEPPKPPISEKKNASSKGPLSNALLPE